MILRGFKLITEAPAEEVPEVATDVVTITATFTGAPSNPTVNFTDLLFDKKAGFMFTKDDGGIGDFTSVFPVLNGGAAMNGVTYPGYTYPDGAGGTRRIGYTFAINGRGNAARDGSNNTVTSWEQYKTILANDNFSLANHSADHSNDPSALQQLQDNEDIIRTELGIDLRTIVLPAGLPGFVAAGLQLDYLLWSSEGYGGPGNGSADGYADDIFWEAKVDVKDLGTRKLLTTRQNFDTYWANIQQAKDWVDEKLTDAANNPDKKFVFSAFAHGPGTNAETAAFNELIDYILSVPAYENDLWFPTLQEFAEYLEVKRLAVKSAPVVNGNTITFTIDLSAIPEKNKLKNFSLKITGGTLSNVLVTGADSSNFNASTGLINIYKKSAARVYGEIPYDPEWGFALDHMLRNDFTQFFNNDLTTNVELSDWHLIDRADIVFPFPEAMRTLLTEVWFGDGQHDNTTTPMLSWVLEPVTYARTPAFTFLNAGNGVWNKHYFTAPKRTDYFVMEWTYPIPTEMKFVGWYVPYTMPTPVKIQDPVEHAFGAVSYNWDFQFPSGGGPSPAKLAVAESCGLFRHYFDTSGSKLPGQNLYTFQPLQSGGWQTDSILQELKDQGAKILFCPKGDEGATYYPDFCEQIAIRYGNNQSVPDNKLKVYVSGSYPGNEVKKGLNLITAIQLGNEPSRWWKGRADIPGQNNLEGYMTPFELGAVYVQCYNKIKAIDPNIEVVLGGTPSNTPAIVQGIMLYCKIFNNGQLCFNSIAYHDYINENGGQNGGAVENPLGIPPEQNNIVYNHTQRFTKIFSSFADNKPIKKYITEAGYSIANGEGTNPTQRAVPTASKDTFRVQADWSIRTALEALRGGISGVAHYQLYDDGNYIYKPYAFMNWDLSNGIAEQDKDGNVNLRPTTDAFRQIIGLLKGYTLDSSDTSNALIIVNKFIKSGQPVIYSLHKKSHNDSTTVHNLAIEGTTATQYNLVFGTIEKVPYYYNEQDDVNAMFDHYTPSNGIMTTQNLTVTNGVVQVTVSETPLFIKITT